MTYSEWKTLPPADQYRFYVSAVCKTAKALLGSNEGSTGENMTAVVRDTLFAKTMMQRWLFVGLPQSQRDRSLDVQQQVYLRRVVQQLWQGTPGFLGEIGGWKKE